MQKMVIGQRMTHMLVHEELVPSACVCAGVFVERQILMPWLISLT